MCAGRIRSGAPNVSAPGEQSDIAMLTNHRTQNVDNSAILMGQFLRS